LPVIEELRRAFPERSIRVLCPARARAANDKVAKLDRLVPKPRHAVL